jgi:hypothetical protein
MPGTSRTTGEREKHTVTDALFNRDARRLKRRAGEEQEGGA